jgi:hypothetical protein
MNTKNFLVGLMSFLAYLTCEAQLIYDTIPSNQVILNDRIKLYINEEVLNQFFSFPDSIKQFQDVCDDNQPYFKKYYGLDIFEIKNHLIREFQIRSTNFRLKFHNISINDSASILKSLFLNAYNQRTQINEKEYLISVFIGMSDKSLIFKIKNEIIIEFKTYFPC